MERSEENVPQTLNEAVMPTATCLQPSANASTMPEGNASETTIMQTKLVKANRGGNCSKGNVSSGRNGGGGQRKDHNSGAKRVKNGGIILEAKIKEVAELSKEAGVKEDFVQNFGGEIKIKDRNHTVIIEHVPVSF